jgi:hypothetical protein
VDAVHERSTLDDVWPHAVSPVGVDGGVVSMLHAAVEL